AVFAYGASVVDMALVIGPTQPPTLAVVIWRDLNAAEPAIAARGYAGAGLLALLIAACAALVWVAMRTSAGAGRRWLSAGPSRLGLPAWPGRMLLVLLIAVYAAVVAVLVIMSTAAHWPYPSLLPAQWSWAAWTIFAGSLWPLGLSIGLALACT